MLDDDLREKLTLRPVTQGDGPLLFRIYAESRTDAEVLATLAFDARQRLLESQYRFQCRHYQQLPNLARLVIQCGHEPVGLIYVRRAPTEIHLCELALLEIRRSKGIGASLMKTLQQEAVNAQLPIVVTVERSNRKAIRFYHRMEFRAFEENETHSKMKWLP